MPAETMADDFHFFRVGPETRIFGVVSTNAMHSLSPVMHNAAFEAAASMPSTCRCGPCDFDDFLSYAAAMGVEGASITIPFKLDALGRRRRADRADAVGGRGEHAASRRRRAGRRPTPTSTGFSRRSMRCSVRA